ncbi:protein FAM72A-like [Petromyzon marinus]|uniref:protein FAM72A-like n=1 Tax=Petromyzon marinus TaxID=7757 RepID=UPI003F721829
MSKPGEFTDRAVLDLRCGFCGSCVSPRGMRAVLLSDPSTHLYSTDAPPTWSVTHRTLFLSSKTTHKHTLLDTITYSIIVIIIIHNHQTLTLWLNIPTSSHYIIHNSLSQTLLCVCVRVGMVSAVSAVCSAVGLVGPLYSPESCACRVQDAACLTCGNVLGYHVAVPCRPCLLSCHNGHLWMFHSHTCRATERLDASGESNVATTSSDDARFATL